MQLDLPTYIKNLTSYVNAPLPYDVTKNAKLTDNFDHFSFTFARPNNIVGCYWRIDPIHQNVGISFVCICYI